MRLKISKTNSATNYYIIKDTKNSYGKRTTVIYERLGTEEDIIKKANGENISDWISKYIEDLNNKEKEDKNNIILKKAPLKLIEKNQQSLFNAGYLFFDKIYHELKIDNICKIISKKYKFEFDLNSILSRLLYSRIIYPASKLATSELSKNFLEQPNFELHQIYRALEIIAKENDFIQSEVYKNSLAISKRNSGILYYDCTNYFFEIEDENGVKQYGKSKENRPNPIVQMGLFMDGDGIPLAFNITPGNTNEQTTMTPLEEKILKDFELSKFIVCTDAGLASTANRKFNDKQNRAFITTQSIKKLKLHLMEWALAETDWKLPNDDKIYNIREIQNNIELSEKFKNATFFKERWINENNLEQNLIVTFSLKYMNYQQNIRNSQIERARKLIENSSSKLNKKNPNDYRRFIEKTSVTQDGEIAEIDTFSINDETITKEAKFDGFYAVATNLDADVSDIIKINNRRWEIEESFRIMKSEFKSRPVHLQRDDRITAHFTTCFLALTLFRFLEKKLDEKFTVHEIIKTLRDMNLKKNMDETFEPVYIRTDLTDLLHEEFDFRTDYEIMKNKKIKEIIRKIKK